MYGRFNLVAIFNTIIFRKYIERDNSTVYSKHFAETNKCRILWWLLELLKVLVKLFALR